MNGAFLGNFEKPVPLVVTERYGERDRPLDGVDHARLGIGIVTVVGVNTVVGELDRDVFERPPLAIGEHT